MYIVLFMYIRMTPYGNGFCVRVYTASHAVERYTTSMAPKTFNRESEVEGHAKQRFVSAFFLHRPFFKTNFCRCNARIHWLIKCRSCSLSFDRNSVSHSNLRVHAKEFRLESCSDVLIFTTICIATIQIKEPQRQRQKSSL